MTPAQLMSATLRETAEGGRTLQLMSPVIKWGRVELMDSTTGMPHYEPWEAIREKVTEGAIVVEGRIAPTQTLLRTDRDDELETGARSWVTLIREVMSKERCSLNIAHTKLRVEYATCPSRPTFYRYLERDRQGLPLRTSDTERGNRTARYSQEIRKFIADLAVATYLKEESSGTLLELTERINLELRHQGHLTGRANISREFVSTVIHEDVTADPKGARMPGKNRISARAIAKRRIRVSLPLQRVEQDALHLPFVVETPQGISRDIYLVHSIDCGTGYPLGWNLIVGTPRAIDTKKCLERTLFSPKEDLLKFGIELNFLLYGTPTTIVWDNGPEVPKARFAKLTRIGISPIYCKARAAHGKPYIERHNLSLKVGLNNLPGCTRVDGKDGQRDPVALGDKLMTLEQLEREILLWKYRECVNNELQRLVDRVFWDDYVGRTPADVLRTLVNDKQVALPLPPRRETWDMLHLEKGKGKLSHKSALTFKKYQFGGEALLYLIGEVGETEVTVFYDPDDYRFVWALIDRTGELITLVNKEISESSPAYTFAEAEAMRQGVPINAEGAKIAADAKRDRYNRSDGVDVSEVAETPQPKRKKHSKREESKETTQRAREDAAAERSEQRPVRAEDLQYTKNDPLPTSLWPITGSKTFEVVKKR